MKDGLAALPAGSLWGSVQGVCGPATEPEVLEWQRCRKHNSKCISHFVFSPYPASAPASQMHWEIQYPLNFLLSWLIWMAFLFNRELGWQEVSGGPGKLRESMWHES